MDIAKFLEEQKFCKVALSGLLTPAQTMFCEKQSKQVVRHGNLRSTYSSDEEQFNSDDSVIDAGKHKVGVIQTPYDNFAYVDAMTNRLNETDLRLLRGSVNDWPEGRDRKANNNDSEKGPLPNSYTNEQSMSNQTYEKKVTFNERPKPRDRDITSNR